MSFLYGNNVLKAHLGRITENTPKYHGVVFYSMADIPLGFGIAAYGTKECRALDPTAIVGRSTGACGLRSVGTRAVDVWQAFIRQMWASTSATKTNSTVETAIPR